MLSFFKIVWPVGMTTLIHTFPGAWHALAPYGFTVCNSKHRAARQFHSPKPSATIAVSQPPVYLLRASPPYTTSHRHSKKCYLIHSSTASVCVLHFTQFPSISNILPLTLLLVDRPNSRHLTQRHSTGKLCLFSTFTRCVKSD